jgi:hypothetical protein
MRRELLLNVQHGLQHNNDYITLIMQFENHVIVNTTLSLVIEHILNQLNFIKFLFYDDTFLYNKWHYLNIAVILLLS